MCSSKDGSSKSFKLQNSKYYSHRHIRKIRRSTDGWPLSKRRRVITGEVLVASSIADGDVQSVAVALSGCVTTEYFRDMIVLYRRKMLCTIIN